MTTYEVTYTVHSNETRKMIVDAIDAIDAKHVAEGTEGEVIITASARKVRQSEEFAGACPLCNGFGEGHNCQMRGQ